MTPLHDAFNWLTENWKVWLDGLGVAILAGLGGWAASIWRKRWKKRKEPAPSARAQTSGSDNINIAAASHSTVTVVVPPKPPPATGAQSMATPHPRPRVLFHVGGSAVSPSQKTYDVFNLGEEIFTLSLELLDSLPDVRTAVSHNGIFRITARSASASTLPELRVVLRFLDAEHQPRNQVFRIPADSSYAQPVAESA